VPSGFRRDGLPFGITLIARAFWDRALLDLGGRFHAATGLNLGTGAVAVPATAPQRDQPTRRDGGERIALAVCGAHMEGLALNTEMTGRQGRLVARTRTAPCYRLYALPGGPPDRPGLVRSEHGAAIEIEVWDLPAAAFGGFVQGVPAPLTIGTLTLEDGTAVKGFLAEAHATQQALDITQFGGWRRYLARRAPE
jgi:allophanate hydrolase